MRPVHLFLPLTMLATPLAAAPPSAPAAPPAPPADTHGASDGEIQIPRELSDPVMIGQVTGMLGALTRAMLNLPIGEIEAAVEGRPANRADRNRTVRDVAGKDDPYFEQRIQDDVARGGVVAQAGMKAMVASLPAITRSLNEAGREIERAVANLPSPVYPER